MSSKTPPPPASTQFPDPAAADPEAEAPSARGVARDPARGFLFALAGTVLVSTNFVTSKFALRGFNPESFSLVWCAAGAVFAIALAAASGGVRGLRPAPGTAWMLAALGLLTGAGMMLTWAGIAQLDPSFAAFLWRLLPVLNILSGVLFLRERLLWIEALPLALMLGGVLVSTLGRWQAVGAGLLLTLVACVIGAAQMLLAKLLVARMDPGAVVFHRLAGATVVIAAWTAATGRGGFAAEGSYWAAVVAGAFIGPCLSHILIFRAYRVWDLSRASLVEISQPLFVIPLAYAFLAQLPAGREVLGGTLILAGAAALGWMHVRNGKAAPAPDRGPPGAGRGP
jgi:drug/metabolite transporter (DMT)-like permease